MTVGKKLRNTLQRSSFSGARTSGRRGRTGSVGLRPGMVTTLLGLVLTAVLGWSGAIGTSATYASSCPTLQFIGVRGSNEHSGFGHTVGSVLSNINAQQSGVGNETVNYWAVNANPWEPAYAGEYMSSVEQGIQNLGADVRGFRDACGSTPIVIAGYSQGAEVIDHWLNSGASLSNIVGVALLGDPRFNPSNGTTIDQGSYNPALTGVSARSDFPHGGIFGGLQNYPAAWRPWVRSYCANHDQICNTSSLAALIDCGIGSSCAHYFYAEADWDGSTYTRDAADFLLGRFRATVHTPSGGGSSGSGSSGSGSAGSGSSGGGSGGSTSTTPSPTTYTETSGSVVHTWTDYSDAGGSEGPEIPSNDSVQIACKVTGFAVADGNTWWYLVASSPWSSAYYASADAFYNNGATSGSLIGTPFVDPSVPDCSGTSGSGGGSKTAYPETSGSVVHTWTDYADAGGSEGPEIPSNDTVQIACKVTGFTVADGNTWWYLVASSPWNSAYYASADAFYNNGATSGSLIGTPFVDPNVPNC